LLVPVPEAEATSRWWELWDPPKERGVPAHVTVLYPFLRERDVTSPVLDGLREAFAGAAPFDFALRVLGRFPHHVYLAAEPAAPFLELTRRVLELHPTLVPYAGEADGELVPHLTIMRSPDDSFLERVEDQARPFLPFQARAKAVWLMSERERGGWQRRAVFPLGGD